MKQNFGFAFSGKHWNGHFATLLTKLSPQQNDSAAIAPSTWVKVLQLPSVCCSDEALLLCQCSDQQWLAWIPDYGEILLDRRQFEPLP